MNRSCVVSAVRARRFIRVVACGLALQAGVTIAQSPAQDSVTLSAFTAGSFRWMDVASNLYAAAYRATYSYTQATVIVRYSTRGDMLTGTLTTTNLKPHFAYQLKLAGSPEAHPQANENLGFSGRWWKEDWGGSAWVNGWNLNNKGTGYAPTSNDLAYLSMRDVADATSPTGRKYRFSAYRVLDYFVTDLSGCATLDFVADSSYHVLFKTSQRAPVVGDGSVKTHAFDAGPGTPAYDTDYPAATVGVYGEWERLPTHGIPLAPGSYALDFLLTEESFHDSGLGGWWAHACQGPAQFVITPDGQPGTVVILR